MRLKRPKAGRKEIFKVDRAWDDSHLYASLCADYDKCIIELSTLTKAVLVLARQWDFVTRSTLIFPCVEATVRAHICDFWIECKKECQFGRDPEFTYQSMCMRNEYVPYLLEEEEDMKRVRERWATGRCSFGMLEAIRRRDGYKCQHCGYTGRLEVDHKIPISRGGSNEWDNLWTLCISDNRSKGAKTVAEWLEG